MSDLACPVQSQRNADERRAESQEQSVAELHWQDAQDRASNKICQAIRDLPVPMRTCMVYRNIVATIKVELEKSGLKCGYAVNGLVDAIIGLDKQA
jgi:hypothetical protein